MARYIFLSVLFVLRLFSLEITAASNDIALLPYSQIYISKSNLPFESIKNKPFKRVDKKVLNFGFDPDIEVWVKINLKNTSNVTIQKILYLSNPLLEKVSFYIDNGKQKITKGLLSDHADRVIMPSILLKIPPNKKIDIYVHIINKTTTMEFGIWLKSKKIFLEQDRFEQNFILFFLGLLTAFIVYSLFLYLYTKNISYALYAFYLLMLIFQQLTYIGFLPLYVPLEFIKIDNLIVVPKVALVIIAAALFAKKFLQTYKFAFINKIYNIFIYFILILVPLVGTPYYYKPALLVIIGFLFVIFNTFAGIYIYIQGNKQARFFIIGWIFLIIGYTFMIFDSLGIISAMYQFPELIMVLVFLEALFLLLAFVDEISILTRQKNALTGKLIEEMHKRHTIIEKEVKEKTKELKKAVDDKVILLREINHRVKNNLQMILSIIRLQKNDTLDKNTIFQFTKLENRINAISKTHQILCQSDKFANIDMHTYISALSLDIKKSFAMEKIDIDIKTNVTMVLKKAVYVGLVINELVSNSLKHGFYKDSGKIMIKLKKEDNCFLLELYDNSEQTKEMNIKKPKDSLGLTLVQALVEKQLNGTIKLKEENNFWYIIKFPKE